MAEYLTEPNASIDIHFTTRCTSINDPEYRYTTEHEGKIVYSPHFDMEYEVGMIRAYVIALDQALNEGRRPIRDSR